MDFSAALVMLKNGHQMCRTGWNSQSQYVELQTPDENSKMKQPYLFFVGLAQTCAPDAVPQTPPVIATCVPWVISQTDLLADDWSEFRGIR